MKIVFSKDKAITKRFGDIANLKRGYDLPSYRRKEGIFPILSSSGITGYHNEFKAFGEGVITGRYGTLGEIYYIQGKYWPHNTALYVYDFKDNYPKYIYYLMKSLNRLKRSDKSTVPGINRNDLHEIKVPYIDKEFQKGISEALYLIDSKVSLNNKINQELELMAKELYNYWFVQFDFPNEKGKPYKTHGGKMEYNNILKREIPSGWNGLLLTNVLEFERGIEPGTANYFTTKESDKHIPFYKVGDMNEESSTWIFQDVAGSSIAKEEDILVSFDGTIGRIVIGLNGAFSTGIRKIYQKTGYFPKPYIYFVFQSEEIQKTIKKRATGSNILHAASAIDILSVPYNERIVRLYYKKTISIFEKILKIKKENHELVQLRDFLLPLFMNGQVKVN
jgi:type I restriction enzyme S subunit